ncbi:MAG TPA: BTAD domain-containing putative transcriptional regulator [Ktedonobacteraceae bacterium]|nr:BTAD domain-containing putative transcriptional regulator [Ktedonobacteraceae bacterium]
MQLEQDIPSSCRLRVYVHGPLEVWKRNASSTWHLVEKEAWGKGRPARSVFKRLLVAPGRRLSRSAIQDDLWPEIENFEQADKTVYNAINQIRRITGKDLLRTLDTSYELADQSLIWVDRDACEALLKEAENRGYTSVEALPLLEQALAYLERGELLEGETGTWVYGLRKHSEDMLKQCRLWLAQAYEAQGKLWQAGEQYRALCTTMPPDEEALQRWMTLLYRQGKQQEALQCYQEIKRMAEAEGFTLSLDQHEALKRLQSSGRPFVTIPYQSFEPLSIDPYTSASRPSTIDEETWYHLDKLIETCWHLSKGNVLDIVETTLWAYLPKLIALANHTSHQAPIVTALASEGLLLAAILAGHHDDLDARQRFSQQALDYSDRAKDRNLQVAALRQLALTYDYKGRPRKALQTYQQTLPLVHEVSPLLRARIYAGLAGSYAQFDQKQEALRSIQLAYESFPVVPEDDPTFLYADCGYFTLVLWEGLMYLDLNQPVQAEQAFTKVDGMQPKIKIPERVRIEFLTYQAETFIATHDLEKSCTYLEEAVKAALALGSERRYTQAFEVYQKMRLIWRHEQRIKALGELFTR